MRQQKITGEVKRKGKRAISQERQHSNGDESVDLQHSHTDTEAERQLRQEKGADSWKGRKGRREGAKSSEDRNVHQTLSLSLVAFPPQQDSSLLLFRVVESRRCRYLWKYQTLQIQTPSQNALSPTETRKRDESREPQSNVPHADSAVNVNRENCMW